MPDAERFTHTTYDLGYAIMDNGDIVTFDGRSLYVDKLQLRMVQEKADREGRQIEFKFRKPTTTEMRLFQWRGIF